MASLVYERENCNAEWELCQQELVIEQKEKEKVRNDASYVVTTATDESGFPISCQQ